MRHWKAGIRSGLVALCIGVLHACGGGGGGDDTASSVPPAAAAVPEVANPVGMAQITAAGGGTLLADAASKIAGASISMPADAAIDDVEVVLGYEDAVPGPFRAEAIAAGATAVSRTIIPHINKGGAATFNKIVKVTVPYDKVAADGLPPTVVYWDEDDKVYRPVAVTSIDRVAGTVTFATSHFSKFLAVVVKSLKIGIPDVDIGFVMGTDSILQQNFGSYEFGGHCMAFASLSSNYFSLKKAKHLHALAQDGVIDEPLDDELTRSALTYTHALLASKWSSVVASVDNPSATDTGLWVLASIIITGQPVHFSMRSDKGEGGHSVTVFGYSAANKQFRIYDSNLPKEEVTFGWDLTNGFATYSKAALYPTSMFANIGYFSDDTFGSPKQFKQIVADWESGKIKDYFANVEVTDTKGVVTATGFGKTVLVEIPYEDGKQVVGHYTRPAGSTKPVFVHLYLDGKKQAMVAPAIDANGNFTVSFPVKLEQKVEVTALVSEHARDPFTGFAAFGRFSVQAEGRNFFVNLGFETGSLTGWAASSRTINNNAPFAPVKTALTDPGFDPIATDLQTVYFGKHALQVNDSTPNYHATLVTQKAIVPTTGNPQLKFSWAAVLQDPQHSPQDQPYVDVVVRNNTSGVELYRKRFFTADPNFAGWKPYAGGQWKSIPWQSVLLTGLSKYAGNEIELMIEGADCGLGGHGGYVYLDGEE